MNIYLKTRGARSYRLHNFTLRTSESQSRQVTTTGRFTLPKDTKPPVSGVGTLVLDDSNRLVAFSTAGSNDSVRFYRYWVLE